MNNVESKESDNHHHDVKEKNQNQNQNQNHESTPPHFTNNLIKYKTGIPTLRSSSHRVRYSTDKASKNKNAPKPKRTTTSSSSTSTKDNNACEGGEGGEMSHGGTLLPLSLRQVIHVPYDTNKYNLKHEIVKLLLSLDSTIVGTFACHNDNDNDNNNGNDCADGDDNRMDTATPTTTTTATSLEYFQVPPISLTRKKQKGKCEAAQEYLSQAVASSTEFLKTFDSFVAEVIVPHLKSRLVQEGVVVTNGHNGHDDTDNDNDDSMHVYYQRPPTLRLQPGPARASVKAHKDSDYGHQPGELNYWIPLTDRHLTGVDLFAETDGDLGDYVPLQSDFGFASSFHGSNCRHYVNTNLSSYTRVSLDFRVGIEPYYDPEWQMIGTKDDHFRRKIKI